MQAEFAKRAETTAAKMQVARNNIRDAAITIGDSLLPVLSSAATAGANLAQVIAGIPAPMRNAGLAVAGVGASGILAAAGIAKGRRRREKGWRRIHLHQPARTPAAAAVDKVKGSAIGLGKVAGITLAAGPSAGCSSATGPATVGRQDHGRHSGLDRRNRRVGQDDCRRDQPNRALPRRVGQ